VRAAIVAEHRSKPWRPRR